MAEGNVEILLTLRNAEQFVKSLKDASTGVEKLGQSTEQAGKQAEKAGGGWKKVAQSVTDASLVYGATTWLKNSVKQTTDLAKSTITLGRATGMETEQATAWAAATQQRGIATADFQKSMVKLSSVMEAARTGTEGGEKAIEGYRNEIDELAKVGGKSAYREMEKLSKSIATAQEGGSRAQATMESLGVSMADLKKGDVETVLLAAADAMQNMESASERNALALQLFGRQGQKLIPMLMKGSEGVEEILEQQRKWGNVVGEESVDATKRLIGVARDLKSAYAGLRVQLGQVLIPVLASLAEMIQSVVEVLQPLLTNSKALKVVIISATIAFIGFKVALLATRIAALAAAGAISLMTLYITLAIVAVIAIAAAFIWAYRNVEWFRKAVDWLWETTRKVTAWMAQAFKAMFDSIVADLKRMWDAIVAVWNWIKQNWQWLIVVLTGPFGVAVNVIVKHWDTIKASAVETIDFLKKVWTEFKDWWNGLSDEFKDIATFKLGDVVPGFEKAGGKGILHRIGVLEGAQAGGTVSRGGALLVGERGPEVVTLPRAAAINPLPLPQAPSPGGAGPLEITVPVAIDGREVARAVGVVTSDKLARR